MGFSKFFLRSRWDDDRARELEAHLAIEVDSNIARGIVRFGSLTSPAILLASHHPPNEKKPRTIPPANAPTNGSEPSC